VIWPDWIFRLRYRANPIRPTTALDDTFLDPFRGLSLLKPLAVQKSSKLAVQICFRDMARLSAICLRQIDLLSRPKDNAFSGLYIGRYSPQAQRHVERIDAERGPEAKLANPMLFRVAGGAQRNGVAIGRLHPDTATGSCTHVRGLRWRRFAAGDAGELTDKSQVLPSPMQFRPGLAAR
jgi:hypothetical protein